MPRTRGRRQFSAQLGDREARLRIGNHPSDSNHQRSRIRARSRFAHLSWLYRLGFIDRWCRFLACGKAEMARPDTKNTTKYWWDKHISGLSLMHADFTCHDFAPHTHDAFVIAVTELGGARIKSRGVTDIARSSGLFVSNREEPQSSWMGDSPRWRYRSMYLTQAAIPRHHQTPRPSRGLLRLQIQKYPGYTLFASGLSSNHHESFSQNNFR